MHGDGDDRERRGGDDVARRLSDIRDRLSEVLTSLHPEPDPGRPEDHGAGARPPETGTAPGRHALPPIRVAIIEDEASLAVDLRPALREVGANLVDVVDAPFRPEDAVAEVLRRRPDVLLCRVNDPAVGRELTREMKERFDGIRVVLLVPGEDIGTIWRGVAVGAAAVLPTSIPPEYLARAIVAASDSVVTVPPSSVRGIASDAERAANLLDELGPDDLRLWEGISRGLPDRAIARELSVSERTVKRRVRSLLTALDVTNRADAAFLAGRCARMLPWTPADP